MTKIMRIILLGAAALSLVLHSVEAGDAKVRRFNLGQHGAVAFEVPTHWEVKFSKLTEENPPTIVTQSLNNDGAVTVSIFWEGLKGLTTNMTKLEMETAARGYAQRLLLPALGQQEMKFEGFNTNGVVGTFARLVAQSLPATTAETHKARYSKWTIGVARWCGYWCTFIIRTHEAEGTHFRESLAVVESLRNDDQVR